MESIFAIKPKSKPGKTNYKDSHKCPDPDCRHSLPDMHNNDGCRVVDLMTGQKCPCIRKGK